MFSLMTSCFVPIPGKKAAIDAAQFDRCNKSLQSFVDRSATAEMGKISGSPDCVGVARDALEHAGG